MSPIRCAASAVICVVGVLIAGCSKPESAQKEQAEQPPIVLQPTERPKPPRPIYRRSAAEVATLIERTCLTAVDESANVRRFEALLQSNGLTPVPTTGHGRMTVWQLPGADIDYANSPKGGRAEDILCLISVDSRGAPEANGVAKALEPILDRGRPEVGRVGPWAYSGFRWKFSDIPDEQTVVKIGDVPENCGDEGLGCTPPFLAVHVEHVGGANTR